MFSQRGAALSRPGQQGSLCRFRPLARWEPDQYCNSSHNGSAYLARITEKRWADHAQGQDGSHQSRAVLASTEHAPGLWRVGRAGGNRNDQSPLPGAPANAGGHSRWPYFIGSPCRGRVDWFLQCDRDGEAPLRSSRGRKHDGALRPGRPEGASAPPRIVRVSRV